MTPFTYESTSREPRVPGASEFDLGQLAQVVPRRLQREHLSAVRQIFWDRPLRFLTLMAV
jgi:hypothetical protein